MTFYYQHVTYAMGNIPITTADRSPCPICGHPTGDCAGDLIKPTHVIGFNELSSLSNQQTVLVEEDIYEERQVSQFTKLKVLLHYKGKQISLDEAKKLGLI